MGAELVHVSVYFIYLNRVTILKQGSVYIHRSFWPFIQSQARVSYRYGTNCLKTMLDGNGRFAANRLYFKHYLGNLLK